MEPDKSIDGFPVQMSNLGLFRSKIMYQFCNEKKKLDMLICYREIIWPRFPQTHFFFPVSGVFSSKMNEISQIRNGEATIINTETNVSSMNNKCLPFKTESHQETYFLCVQLRVIDPVTRQHLSKHFCKHLCLMAIPPTFECVAQMILTFSL